MGKISNPRSVKLITGFIYQDPCVYLKAKTLLNKKFGEIDFESEPLAFIYTDYYQKEFGKNLLRKFISFKKLISPEKLPQIKSLSNKIEARLACKKGRKINIDPGYLDMAKLVLASTKDYYHRIYLNNGLYAEITLFYRGKTFRPWEWTYPDYKTPEYIRIFNQIRGVYAGQI
jgi:hypothetical protein